MNRIYLSLIFISVAAAMHAQKLEVKETWASGYARSVLYTDYYSNESQEDTTTSARQMSGHTLLDLAVNIKPTERVFVQGMIRIRNDHGGFWGSGVTFDARNLYLRGLIGKGFRYQVGDIQYKLTPYTLFNPDEETSMNEAPIFNLMREMNLYDLFLDQDNSWRQQGATGEFGLTFKKGIEELDASLFTSRLNWNANNGFLDRLMAGGTMQVKQSKYVDARITYVNAYDLLETSPSTDRFSNPVLTGGVGLHKRFDDWMVHLNSEFGQSKLDKTVGDESITREDHFSDVRVKLNNRALRLSVNLGFQDIGPDFRSIGAQTKRLNFQSAPLAFQRYGNEQNLRAFGMLDIIRDASLYNTTLRTNLMAYNPAYGNAQPYGDATPNRRNMMIGADWEDASGYADINVQAVMGKEILGQGTTELKDFTTVNSALNIHMDKLIGFEKEWTITAAIWSEGTKRSGEAFYEKVDLQNQLVTLSTEFEVVEDLQILAGYRNLNSSGNDYVPRKDVLDEIITFQEYNVDLQQDIYAIGLRYNFSDTSLINFQWTGYSNTDNLDLNDDYTFSDISLIYRMRF